MSEPISNENDWMSPLNKIIWHRAIKRKATEVTIRDGRKFTVEYKTRKDHEGNVIPIAWVAPEDWPTVKVPCGYLNVERVSDPMWVALGKKDVAQIGKKEPND